MQRIGQVVRLRPEAVLRYEELHASVWPDVLRTIKACNISNYSIFLYQPELLLFAYFEYTGEDFDADQARMAADPVTQEWWSITMPLQEPLEGRAEGEWCDPASPRLSRSPGSTPAAPAAAPGR
jgi:L-rhamnose mutarotase